MKNIRAKRLSNLPQDVVDVRARISAKEGCRQGMELAQEREVSVLQSAKLEGVGDLKSCLSPWTSDMEGLEFALLGCSLALVQCFLSVPPFFHFGIVMYSLCHCVLEVCNLPFDCAFTGDYS